MRKALLMKIAKLTLLQSLLPLLLMAQVRSGPAIPANTDSKMKWWTDARFGLFLHWGLYSVTAGDWNGHPAKGGEHFMLHERIPLKTYALIARDFNPVKFKAEAWVLAAKRAGMKYIVITSKHHDGFSMYDSKVSNYNIVKTTPYGKDPMKELAAACKKYGMKLCFYYSLGRDWEDPDVPTYHADRSNLWDYPNESAKNLDAYLERKVKPQLKELLTNYGPIGVIWFDTPELITREQSKSLRELVLSLQPGCIVNDRIGNGFGDFGVSEQKILDTRNTKPWEACITMSRNWSYNRHDTAWKSPELLVYNLVDIASKGGNFLLNIGPKGDGTFPAPALANLKAVGRWMAVNGAAIYGSTSWKVTGETAETRLPEETQQLTGAEAAMKDAVNDATSKKTVADIRYTAKGNAVYAFARSWHKRNVTLKSVPEDQIKNISLLGYPGRVDWETTTSGLRIDLPAKFKSKIPIYVFKIEMKHE